PIRARQYNRKTALDRRRSLVALAFDLGRERAIRRILRARSLGEPEAADAAQKGHAENLRDLRPDLPRFGVDAVAAGEHEIRADPLDRARQRARRRERIGAGEANVAEVDGAIDAQRQALAQGGLGLWRAHRQHAHRAADLLAKPQRLEDGASVERVDEGGD